MIRVNSSFMDGVFGKMIASKSLIISSVLSLQAKASSKLMKTYEGDQYIYFLIFPDFFFDFLKMDPSGH